MFIIFFPIADRGGQKKKRDRRRGLPARVLPGPTACVSLLFVVFMNV